MASDASEEEQCRATTPESSDSGSAEINAAGNNVTLRPQGSPVRVTAVRPRSRRPHALAYAPTYSSADAYSNTSVNISGDIRSINESIPPRPPPSDGPPSSSLPLFDVFRTQKTHKRPANKSDGNSATNRSKNKREGISNAGSKRTSARVLSSSKRNRAQQDDLDGTLHEVKQASSGLSGDTSTSTGSVP
eukprot:100243-Pyramimonas_sp.AAC.1